MFDIALLPLLAAIFLAINMRGSGLSDGTVWSIPIILSVKKEI
jgi:hypothetical protein